MCLSPGLSSDRLYLHSVSPQHPTQFRMCQILQRHQHGQFYFQLSIADRVNSLEEMVEFSFIYVYCVCVLQVAQCCKGFYGPDCKPCIGGFEHPCYDKGAVSIKHTSKLWLSSHLSLLMIYHFLIFYHMQCFDGIQGNGSCSCQSGFKGVACHICADPSKHGEKCDEGNSSSSLWESSYVHTRRLQL